METFMGSKRGIGKITIFGIPFEGRSSFRHGSKYGPLFIRKASQYLEDYSPLLKKRLDVWDGGDISLEHLKRLHLENVKPVFVGGDHSITYHIVKKLKPDAVIQLDAHADLRNEYLGDKFSHACVMRRIRELGIPYYQWGLRSYCEEEEPLINWLGDELPKKAYVSIDMDVFDPSIAPGVSTPEPGGKSYFEVMEILKRIGERVEVLGFDIVEVCPPYDISQITALLAAKLIREGVLIFWEKNNTGP